MSDPATAMAVLPARVRDRDLSVMPCDWGINVAAARELDLRQLGAWHRLRMHLYKYGALPTGHRDLALLCGMGLRSFERMAPALALHFDRDEQGRWTDFDLMKARGNRAVVPQREPVKTALSEQRAEAGRAGAAKRWNRPHLELVPSEVTIQSAFGPDGEGPLLPSSPMAKSAADDGNLRSDETVAAGVLPSAEPCVLPSAPRALGSNDRSFSLEDSNDRSSDPCASAGAPMANRLAKGDGSFAADDGKGVGPEDGKTDVADDGKIVPAMPSRSLAEVDDQALIAALREAGGVKIPALLLNAKDLDPIRRLVADGCELERDVVPAVRNFVQGCRDPLRTFSARVIREKAVASRDHHSAIRSASNVVTSAGIYVDEGTKPWRAWLRAKGVRSHCTTSPETDRTRRGWWFPTLWPPGWDEARLSAAEPEG